MSALEDSPVVLLEGARGTGKRTLADDLTAGSPVHRLDLDDDRTRSHAEQDPVGLLLSADGSRLLITEVQRCPTLLPYLGAYVGRDPQAGRALLTSSTRLPALPSLLDGMVTRLDVLPFSHGETAGRRDDWVSAVLRHPLPAIRPIGRPDVAKLVSVHGYAAHLAPRTRVRADWITEYLRVLVEQDSLDAGATQPELLSKLLGIIARAVGDELVTLQLSKKTRVARGTVDKHLDALAGLFLLQRIPATSLKFTDRQIKRDKAVLSDSRLTTALLGVGPDDLADLDGSETLRRLLLQLVANELRKQATWTRAPFHISHLRDRNGLAVDLLLETDAGIIAIDVSPAAAATPRHFRALERLRDLAGPQFVAGYVLNLGEPQRHGDRLHSLPVNSLWEA